MSDGNGIAKNAIGNWLHQAIQDYAAARCCLINGLFPGFVLAQQSVEKLLKAYLRAATPGWTRLGNSQGVLPDVHASHDLVAFAKETDTRYPALRLLEAHEPLLARLSRRFEGKYPDGRSARLDASTAELTELDDLALQLFTSVPLHRDLKVRSGIYPLLWHLVDQLQAVPSECKWVLAQNVALNRQLPELVKEIQDSSLFTR